MTVRVFVGLAPERPVAQALVEAAVRVLDPAAWRLHGAADIHLTLCFVGAIEAVRREPLAERLHEALAGRRSPVLEIAGTGAFPPAGDIRALFAGVRGTPEDLSALGELRRAAGLAIASAGLAWDERPAFTPHLTLARPRGRPALMSAFERLEFAFAWRPTEVFLFESGGRVGDRYPRRAVATLDPDCSSRP